ncbi:hypothetical protein [[Eubacterium] cellulosolvens]
MNREYLVRNYLILSFIAAVLVLLVVWSFTINPIKVNPIEKFEVGLLFIFCCIIGISLVMKPNWIHICPEQQAQRNYNRNVKTNSPALARMKKRRIGHHPDCDRFRRHTIKINDKIYCAGCTGLAIGAVLAIFLMVLVIILPFNPSKTILFALLILGLILIAFNLASTMNGQKYGREKSLLNVFLVLGFFMVITGVFMLTGALIFGILGVLVCVLWLDTRILLSKHNHHIICTNCQVKCGESF